MDSSVRLGLVVEDQTDTRLWLEEVLGEALGPMRVATAATQRDGMLWLNQNGAAASSCERQAIALIDLVLPDGSGISLIREIADKYPGVLPIVISIYDDDHFLFDAIAAGAQGYLLKDEAPAILIRRLREIDQGELPLSPSIARRMLAHFQRPGSIAEVEAAGVTLTSRERDVLALLGKGLRVGDAAVELGLTRNTVAGYVKVIYSKLNIASRAEAALEAKRRGLI